MPHERKNYQAYIYVQYLDLCVPYVFVKNMSSGDFSIQNH